MAYSCIWPPAVHTYMYSLKAVLVGKRSKAAAVQRPPAGPHRAAARCCASPHTRAPAAATALMSARVRACAQYQPESFHPRVGSVRPGAQQQQEAFQCRVPAGRIYHRRAAIVVACADADQWGLMI
eukprot:COSAG01_NODE_6493_length_3632_cov_7.039343_1_plen_126_part_00